MNPEPHNDLLQPYAKNDAEITLRMWAKFDEIERDESKRRLRRWLIVIAVVVVVCAIAAFACSR